MALVCAMRRLTCLIIALALPAAARAETVYDFTQSCRDDQLKACFARIEERLDLLRAKHQRRAFCIPQVWGATMVVSESYPVSILEYVRVRVSAARFGRAEQDVDTVITEIVGAIYPCR